MWPLFVHLLLRPRERKQPRTRSTAGQRREIGKAQPAGAASPRAAHPLDPPSRSQRRAERRRTSPRTTPPPPPSSRILARRDAPAIRRFAIPGVLRIRPRPARCRRDAIHKPTFPPAHARCTAQRIYFPLPPAEALLSMAAFINSSRTKLLICSPRAIVCDWLDL